MLAERTASLPSPLGRALGLSQGELITRCEAGRHPESGTPRASRRAASLRALA